MWPQSTPLTTFSPYQPPGEGGSGTRTLAGLRGLCHFHKVTEGTLTDARGLACGWEVCTAPNWLRPKEEEEEGEEGVRESRGGGRGRRREKGGGGGGKDKGEAEGEGRKGEECEEGAPLPQGPHSSPTGTKAPAPSVPRKICPVPLPLEHQSWFPVSPKVASFEVWQRWGHISG